MKPKPLPVLARAVSFSKKTKVPFFLDLPQAQRYSSKEGTF
jgi:hypothetical protein